MLEGLFVPWHLLIIVAVVFVAVGPRRLVRHWRHTSDSLQELIEGPTSNAPERDIRAGATPAEASRGVAFRIGRRLRRRR